ncbi:MAG TPA: contractile injection system tape measure protein [Allosphingosinicella sp.]|jgi:hypothetical protein
MNHAVASQRIEVRSGSEAWAWALLDRIGGLNHSRLLPAIERVFDEFDRAGEVIRIGRLELDLGRFAEGALDEVEARLTEALRAAIRQALGNWGRSSSAVPAPALEAARQLAAVLSVGTTLVEALEHFLLGGSWPYSGAVDGDSNPADLLCRLIGEAPSELAAMLRRQGASERVIRRLAWQMPEPLLERLLAVLEPAQAAWISAYMRETRAAHALEPVIDEPPASFSHRLWMLVLRDALNRSGLHANRRAFLRKLIEGMAEGSGESYAALLTALRRSLEAIPEAGRRAGSLLATLGELAAFAPEAPAPDAINFAAFAALLEGRPAGRLWLGSDGTPWQTDQARDLARRGMAAFPAEARWLIRRLARDEQDGVHRLFEAGAVNASRGGTAGEAGTALAALCTLLGKVGEDAVATSAALAEAMADDPIGTRRLLRRFARADPHRFLILSGVGAEEAPELLLIPAVAAPVRRLIERLQLLPAENLTLVRHLARMSEAVLPETALFRLLVAVAAERGVQQEALARAVLQAPAGGDPRLTEWLERTATGDVQPEGADAAGAETIDVLRRGLLTGSPLAPQAAAELRRLAQIPPELLRERLRGPFSRVRTATALAPLADGDLLRLALLLLRGVPGGSERIRRLPSKGAARRAELVQILAGLFAKGRLVPMPEEQVGTPRQDRGRRDLRRRALADLLGDAIVAAVVAWPESLKDEDAVERLLHALPPDERPAALAFARLLTGARAARVLPPGLAARALAAAAADRLGGAGHTGLALIWRQRLDQGLSSEQRSALRRLLDDALPVSADARGLRRPATPSARQARSEPGLQGEAAAQAEPGSLAWALALLDRGTPETKRLLRAALRAPHLRERLCKALPDRLLLRFVTVLAPREAFPLVRMALIFAAAHQRCGARLSRAEMWAAAIEAAASPDPVTALVRTLIDPKSAAMRGRGPALADRIAAEASALASSRGEPALKAALNDRAYDLRRRSSPSTAPPADPRRKLWEKAPEPGGRKIHVRNAGLVLAAPFLPQLFDGLGLLGEQGLGSPRPEEALSRGVHLLQYLVDGRLDASEPALALNKLLCGADPADPVLASIEASANDLTICDSLLEAIVAHWPVMAGSSTAALQELFVQREGALVRTEEGWRVDVERKTVDVLRDAIPWGFSMILHPWMPELLKVDWVTATG